MEHSLTENNLLKHINKSDFDQLKPFMELVTMPQEKILCELGSKLSHVYFPTSALVSILYKLNNGTSAELALVGNEGMIGIDSLMGDESIPRTVIVQHAGYGYRIKASIIKHQFSCKGTLFLVLLRYTQALTAQMVQNVICNHHHCIDEQLCRFLLLRIDRLLDNHINMTQEKISNLIGVRREGITEAAGKLHKAGIISYSRGHIIVLDRVALEDRACECYQVVKNEFDRLFPDNINQPVKDLAII